MSPGGTFAATRVAEMPQANRYGTLTEPDIGERLLNGTDVQRQNPGFAAHRGLQSPSEYHMSARRMVPRHAMIPNSPQRNGTAIGSLVEQRFHPASAKQL